MLLVVSQLDEEMVVYDQHFLRFKKDQPVITCYGALPLRVFFRVQEATFPMDNTAAVAHLVIHESSSYNRGLWTQVFDFWQKMDKGELLNTVGTTFDSVSYIDPLVGQLARPGLYFCKPQYHTKFGSRFYLGPKIT